MKAVEIKKYGHPDGLAVVDAPGPTPANGQLLIATEAIGVGGVDAVIRRGEIGDFPEGLIPGSEVAGRVTAVGEGVARSWIGRRVWAFTGLGGAYAESAVAALDDVTPLPDGLCAVDAVTIGSAGPVAHFGLSHARFTRGESVLVRGAAGSLGILAVQLVARGGASTVAVTTSSPERGHRLRELGATLVLDRSGAAEREFDVVYDVVGGPGLPSFFDRLAPNGRLVCVGAVDGYPPDDLGAALVRLFRRSLTYATFSLDTVPVPDRNRVRADLLEATARGELTSVVHDVLPLDEAAEAHRRMDAGEVFGRIVLTTAIMGA